MPRPPLGPALAAGLRLRTPPRGAAAYVAYFVAVGAWFPYLPVFYRDLGLDLPTIGLFSAAGAATTLVASPAWGAVADRFGRSGRTVAVAGLLAAAAGVALWLAGAAAHASADVTVARVVPVLAGAIATAAAMAGVGTQLDVRAVDAVGDDRAAYGRLRAWGSVAFIVSAPLVGVLLDRTGPSGLFAAFVPALLATAAIVLLLDRSRARRPVPSSRRAGRGRVRWLGPGVGELLQHRPLRAFLLAMLVCWSALNAVNSFFSVHLVALGAQPNLVGIAWAVSAGLEVPIMWSFPVLAARFGTGRLLVVGPMALGVRALGCALAPTPEVLVAVTALQGIGFSLSFVGAVTHVARLAPPELAATGQGLLGSVTVGFGAILGGAIGGSLAPAIGLRGVFALGAAASVVAALLVVRSFRIERRVGARSAGYDRSVARPVVEAQEPWTSG